MAGNKETSDLLDKTPSRGGWWKWLLGIAVVAAAGGFLLWLAFGGPVKTTIPDTPAGSSESAAPIRSHDPADSSDGSGKPIEEAKVVESSAAEPVHPIAKPDSAPEAGTHKTSEVVYFATGSSAINPEEKAKLNSFAGLLKSKSGNLLIEGHADAIGTEEFNESLSKQRADQVLSYLRSVGLGDGWKVDLKFYGEKRPASDNDTVEGRSKNRRVELAIE